MKPERNPESQPRARRTAPSAATPPAPPAAAAAAPDPFDLASTPLEPGTWLIQASAGTGKTFTLSGLFLRLLLERDFPVREILVVTFTEAATGELRDRIRRGLARARQAVDDPKAGDEVITRLLQRAHLPPATLRDRLERALRAFDEAPIHTIHSFCQRALRDRAFESGELFDTELLTDDSDLRQQVADDFWRRTFHDASPAVAGVLLRHGRSPGHLAELLSQHSRHPDLTILSGVDDRSLQDLAATLDARLGEARELWRGERHGILSALDLSESALQGLAESPDWAIKEHGKPHVLGAALAGVEGCLGREGAGPAGRNLRHLEFFTPAALAKGTGKRAAARAHPFFDLCGEWEAAAGAFLIGVDLAFLRFARAELPRRKRALKVQSFDDLLTRLRDALRAPGGASLGAELRGKFRAALIDEFQDTDPVQWEIFRTVFGGTPAAGPAPCLFLIGDPKQAIYGFRGADIFTYLDAARGVPAGRSFTLDKNWRSEARLVQAVNAFFGAAPDPFACREIGFHPVTAAGEADEKPLTEDGRRLPPFRLWFASRADRQKNISKKEAEGSLPAIVAGEIVRLLQGDLRIGGRRLSPRDIAVLVLENRQAALLQRALRAVGVPAVLHTEESVFATREARELKLALAALAQPGREGALRAALATDLLGRSGTDLDHLARHPAEWESLLEHHRRLHQLWLDRGFVPLFREWLNQHEVRRRLLRFEDGERRLTNLLHLAEVLHAAAHEHRLGPAGLVRWLDEQLTAEGRAREEHQLRLERDDEAVRLVTVHKSKGLEYPVVFCPFSWKSSDIERGGEDQVFFHERPPAGQAGNGMSRFIHDLGSPRYEQHRRLAFHERLMENLRVLYVALTRARHRCYFVWGAFNGAETSAAAWLLHPPHLPVPGPDPAEPPDLEAAMAAHFKGLQDSALLEQLEDLARRTADATAGPCLAIEPLPDLHPGRYQPETPAAATAPAPRAFHRTLDHRWRITSFSGLIAGRTDERPDHDPEEPGRTTVAAPAAEPAPATGIFAFPRGTAAGTCLHHIFEHLDFTQAGDDAVLGPLVEDALRRHGLDPKFAGAVRDNVRATLGVPLEPGTPASALAHVAPADRMNELEFCLPVRELSPALIQQGLAGSRPELATRLGALGFHPAEGFLRGFIDLVFRRDGRFYIVDWKSNWLGNRAEDYHPDALREAMDHRFYGLQYHLYALALHEYLTLRLPGYDAGTHFGGVYYLFLRGLDPARPGLGVFHDRPTPAVLENLRRAILAGREAAP